MQPWLETLGIVILAFLGLALGLGTSRLRKPYWIFGYALPLLPVVMVGLVRNINRLRFVLPFSLISAGRNEFAISAFAVPMLFGTLIPRLPKKREKILTSVLLAVASVYFFIFPFLVPALIRNRLENLQTVMLNDGICLQSTNYTCGPAAAVTALHQLGIEAKEGKLAVLAHSTPQLGTPDDLLAQAIEKRYGAEGVRCTYRYFSSIAQLKETCPTIAVVKFAFFVDHYVTVLEVSDDLVTIADPLAGEEKLNYEEFAKKWRFIGIVVERNVK